MGRRVLTGAAMGDRPWHAQLRPLLLAAASAAVLLHCWHFRDFVVDDAVVSYSYAKNLASGHGLVITPGWERGEGYTNFLWVILLAVWVRAGVDVFLAAKLLGAALAVAVVLGAAELTAALRARRSALDGLAALITAALLPVAYWAMSGLEGGLYTALVVWCVVRLLRELSGSAWPLSALLAAGVALTRPDGMLVLVVAAAARLFAAWRSRREARGGGLRDLVPWLALALAPVLAHELWRWLYYAYPLPNTFYAKMGAAFRWSELRYVRAPGWQYVLGVVFRYRLWPFLGAAAFALARVHRLWARLVVAAVLAALVFFPLYAGGDWMSEGRFLVAGLPLLAALALDGSERAVELMARLPMPRAAPAAVLAMASIAVAGWWLPHELELSAKRRDDYPVPSRYVAIRAREYRRLADRLSLPRPSVVDGDLGATSYFAGMPVIEALGDVTMARWKSHPAIFREYIYGERQPAFFRLVGFWLGDGLQLFPEFASGYLPLPASVPGLEGLSIARAAFTVFGIDPRRPLATFDAAGVALLGADLGAADRRLWLLVLRDHPGGELALESGGAARPVTIGDGLYPPVYWRAGEVLRASAPGGPGPGRLCAGRHCVELPPGASGAQPKAPPAPTSAALARARARADVELEGAITSRLGSPTPELARTLYRHGLAAAASGDADRAYRHFRAALEQDRSLSWARRHLEALRLQPRSAYHHRWVERLDRALRELQLHPDAEHLGAVAALSMLAGRPEPAVRAHVATG